MRFYHLEEETMESNTGTTAAAATTCCRVGQLLPLDGLNPEEAKQNLLGILGISFDKNVTFRSHVCSLQLVLSPHLGCVAHSFDLDSAELLENTHQASSCLY